MQGISVKRNFSMGPLSESDDSGGRYMRVFPNQIRWLPLVAFSVCTCTHHGAFPHEHHVDQPSPPRTDTTKPSISNSITPPSSTRENADPPLYIEYRYFPSAKEALLSIVAETRPRVIGFGEYHNQTSHTVVSALNRFTRTLLPAISPVTSDIIVEALVPTGDCESVASAVEAEIKEDTERPETTEDETVTLFREARIHGVFPHFLTLTCQDNEHIYGQETVDYMTLLELIGQKLAKKTEEVLGFRAGLRRRQKPLVTIYGGAAHNDVSPLPEWQRIAFGPYLEHQVPPGKYVEIDLIVPELVADNVFVHREQWYPLYRDKVATDKTLLIKRSTTSYIIVFPKSV